MEVADAEDGEEGDAAAEDEVRNKTKKKQNKKEEKLRPWKSSPCRARRSAARAASTPRKGSRQPQQTRK